MMNRPAPSGLPPAQGLYDPRHEHDACGIGFVAGIKGVRTHEIVRKGIEVLVNLTHRGACGCDPETGDGAGVLIQIPHKFFARECRRLNIHLPEPGQYGVGMIFLPVERHDRLRCEGILERIAREEGLLVGISSAAAVVGSLQSIDGLKKGQNAVVVTILCDSGDKYLSERFWDEA